MGIRTYASDSPSTLTTTTSMQTPVADYVVFAQGTNQMHVPEAVSDEDDIDAPAMENSLAPLLAPHAEEETLVPTGNTECAHSPIGVPTSSPQVCPAWPSLPSAARISPTVSQRGHYCPHECHTLQASHPCLMSLSRRNQRLRNSARRRSS